MSARKPVSGGFTRTDLAGLVATLSFLALLSPPLLGNPRIHGEASTCLDNLRRLTLGWLMYAADNQGWLPPNPDDASSIAGRIWVSGQAGPSGPEEFNSAILADPRRSMVFTYAGSDVTLFRCPADPRRGVYRPGGTAPPQPDTPAARSVAANLAVGTNPSANGGKAATDGAWLDNRHSHTANRQWRTYGRLDDMIAPAPAGLFMLIDEDEASINDGLFAFGMVDEEWIDWPASRHDLGAAISFADGHAELHRWTDQRTVVVGHQVAHRLVPDSEDYAWLRARTSAPVQ